jgi:hypothetical protein
VRYSWTEDGLPDSAGPPFANAWPDRLGADPAVTKTEGGVRCAAFAWGDLRCGERPFGTDDRRATGQQRLVPADVVASQPAGAASVANHPVSAGVTPLVCHRVPTGECGSNGGRLPDSPT